MFLHSTDVALLFLDENKFRMKFLFIISEVDKKSRLSSNLETVFRILCILYNMLYIPMPYQPIESLLVLQNLGTFFMHF